MRIDVVTLFPERVEMAAEFGITRRSRRGGIMDLVCWNPRDFTEDRHRTVDDRPYGGGPGMVMKVEPLRAAIKAARAAAPEQALTVYLSPQGRRLDQRTVRRFSDCSRLILVCGRYEGIDERVVALEIDEEWSIGDYVLSGGELAAMVVVDAVTRLLPGALGHEDSAGQDSFSDGLLDHPHYTRPEAVEGFAVPEVLTSGDHQAIADWRRKQSLGRTWLRRPELLEEQELDGRSRRLLDEFKAEYRSRQRRD